MNIDTDSIKQHYPIIDIARRLGIEVSNSNTCHCIHHSHTDNNPSMSFCTKTNTFKCFSRNCQFAAKTKNSYDVIDLVMYVLNYDFTKACEYITGNTYNTATYSQNNGTSKINHIKTPCRNESNVIKQTESIKQVSSTNINIYTDFINLLDYTEAIEYLNARRITEKITKQYRIKNLPKDYNKQTEITKQLQSKYTDSELIDSGLFAISQKTNNLYNRFYNHRLIIPFIENNNIVSLQSRSIDTDKQVHSKYNNLKNNTRIFNIELLDNLPHGSYILICEGIIDCLSWQRLTFNCIAIGSSSNVDKLNDSNILKKLSKYKIRLVGDNDNSGNAMNEKIKKLLDKYCIQTKSIDLQSIAKAYHISNSINDINDILTNIKLNTFYSKNLGNLYFCKYEKNKILFLDYGYFDNTEIEKLSKDNIEIVLKLKKAFDNDIKVITDEKLLTDIKNDYINIKHKEIV